MELKQFLLLEVLQQFKVKQLFFFLCLCFEIDRLENLQCESQSDMEVPFTSWFVFS